MTYNPAVHGFVRQNLRPQLPEELSSYVSDEEIYDNWYKAQMCCLETDEETVKELINLLEEHVSER